MSYKRKLITVLSIFILIPCLFLGMGYLRNIKRDIYNNFSEEKNIIAKAGIGNIQSSVNSMYEKIDFVTNFNKLSHVLGTDFRVSILEALEVYTEINNVFEAFFPKADMVDMLVYTTNPNIYNMKFVMKINPEERGEFDSLPEGAVVQRISSNNGVSALTIYKKYNVFNEYYNVIRVSVPLRELGKRLEEVDYAFYRTGGKLFVIQEPSKNITEFSADDFEKKSIRDNYYVSLHTIPYLDGEIITVFDKTEPNLKYKESLILLSLVMALVFGMLILLLNFTAVLLTKKLSVVISEIKPGVVPGAKNQIDEFDIIKDKLTELLTETKRENDKILALETEMLHQKISPHFLYNNLSAVKWNLNDEAQGEIIDALVSYYRNVFQKASSECSLDKELEGIEKYVELLKFSYGKSFIYSAEVEERFLKRNIPSNILQPLVENAFIHGVNRFLDDGIINIRAYEDENYFMLEVTDNGNAELFGKIEKINAALANKEGGSAINLVDKRIRLYYGEGYGLKYAKRGADTAAILCLPRM